MRVISRALSAVLVAAASTGVPACVVGGVRGPEHSPTVTTYTCCEARDVDTVYHPGQTLSVHWIVVEPSEGVSPGAGRGLPVELRAELTGPYPSVPELKSAEAPLAGRGSRTFRAPTVRPARVAGERPVSAIAIPRDAASGYYELTFSIREIGGGTVSGASIVQVTDTTT